MQEIFSKNISKEMKFDDSDEEKDGSYTEYIGTSQSFYPEERKCSTIRRVNSKGWRR